MFNVGDLVRLKQTKIARSRYGPDKIVGIVVSIEREKFDSWDGKKEDYIKVRWMPWGKEEMLMGFYLEHMESTE